MSFVLKNKFLANARGITFEDANSIAWSFDPNTNRITAAYSGAIGSGNPTAQVGLSAVNGSAATFMRSDAAPAIDEGIAPTWTQTHTFGLAPVMAAGLNTYSGNSGNLPNNTATTIKTLPSGGNGAGYIVFASLIAGAGSPQDYSVTAIVNVSNSAAVLTEIVTAVNLSLTISGLDVQVTQTSGGAQSSGANWAILRIY